MKLHSCRWSRPFQFRGKISVMAWRFAGGGWNQKLVAWDIRARR